jgi:GrpB-like predicted nucleotidyltransferase (UPF0157 family)
LSEASERSPGVPPIVIVEYDPQWPVLYALESKLLHEQLGSMALRIEHVGSTSIPGIGAKPVIDIQISVRELHPLDPYRELLERAGYQHDPHADDASYPFFHKPTDWPHSHHVHVCSAGGAEESRHLAFRDFLRDHPETAAAYEREKRALASQHHASNSQSRNAYAEAKSDFIEPLVRRALAEGYPRD